MKTAWGLTPRRLTPVLLVVTIPSLSSLPFVPRLDETGGERLVCGFRDVVAKGMIGTEGANFVRFGRGMAKRFDLPIGPECRYYCGGGEVDVAMPVASIS